ncbi:MAG: DUF6122 family protein [Psychroflexus salarius]
MLQPIIHYSLHFVFIAWFAHQFKRQEFGWFKVYLILLSSMLIDIDHLWATPIFDPNRCSVGFHTFHSEISLGLYILVFLFSKEFWLKLLTFGLIFHIITDEIDCLMSTYF